MTQFIGRTFTRLGAQNYCSPPFGTRAEAIEACSNARPRARKCMTSEARFNDNLKQVVPTHDRIQWVDIIPRRRWPSLRDLWPFAGLALIANRTR